jgi:hypothetical protein
LKINLGEFLNNPTSSAEINGYRVTIFLGFLVASLVFGSCKARSFNSKGATKLSYTTEPTEDDSKGFSMLSSQAMTPLGQEIRKTFFLGKVSSGLQKFLDNTTNELTASLNRQAKIKTVENFSMVSELKPGLKLNDLVSLSWRYACGSFFPPLALTDPLCKKKAKFLSATELQKVFEDIESRGDSALHLPTFQSVPIETFNDFAVLPVYILGLAENGGIVDGFPYDSLGYSVHDIIHTRGIHKTHGFLFEGAGDIQSRIFDDVVLFDRIRSGARGRCTEKIKDCVDTVEEILFSMFHERLTYGDPFRGKNSSAKTLFSGFFRLNNVESLDEELVENSEAKLYESTVKKFVRDIKMRRLGNAPETIDPNWIAEKSAEANAAFDEVFPIVRQSALLALQDKKP